MIIGFLIRSENFNVGLVQDYQSQPEIKRWVRMTAALAFLPLDDVDYAWNSLYHNTPVGWDGFATYFTLTWIGDGATEPIFKPELWSVWNQIGADRTNNRLEG